MEKLEMLYEGKAKKLYSTDEEDVILAEYMDQATALNGLKKDAISGKGAMNNQITSLIFDKLAENGVPSHFIRKISETEQLIQKVEIIPLEVVVRNVAAGSFSKRLGIAEGTELKCSTLEFSYKDDDLGDPLINSYMARAIGAATQEEIDTITKYAFTVNEVLKEFFAGIGIELIDFKLEFGKTSDGTIVLADEISPDTCRYWDIKTGKHLDKDTFRRDLGDPEGAYQEVFRRMGFGE